MTRALPMSQLWNSKRETKSTAYVLLMVCLARDINECTPIFMGHVDMSGEGIYMRPIGDPSGRVVRKWFQSYVY